MAAVTRQQLDKLQCALPDCDHTDCKELFFHSRCHFNAPTWTMYDKTTGILSVRCSICKTLVTEVRVARGIFE